jgi:putative acetyltransferase
MVLMVSIAVSKTEGPGSSPGTPATTKISPTLKIDRAKTRKQFNSASPLLLEYMEALRADPGSKHLPLQNISKDISHLATDFAPPKGGFWLAIQDGQIVGCVGLRTLRNRQSEMKRLWVREKGRRHGVGRMLVLACIKYAKENRCLLLRLATTPSMTGAISLYESLGFKKGPPWRKRNIDGYVFMTLSLDQKVGPT